MAVSVIILSIVFIVSVVLIITEKLNRAIVTMSGALITYLVLTFIEGKEFQVMIDLLFGTTVDGFVNFHSLVLILGIMFIVQVAEEAGTVQFVAIYAIKMSRGKSIALMTILCFLSVIFSAIINNILTVMVLIPLTITISRMLDLDPTPYILTQAILVNNGGTLFVISSIPNILISTYADISFADFFINVGLFSIVTVGITILFFIFMYKKELIEPEPKLVANLDEFNPWNAVQNRRLFYTSLGAIILLMLAFIIVPSDIIPPSMICLIIAMVLTIISTIEGLDAGEIIKKFDYELLFYLLGIFVIAGGLEKIGLIETIGIAFRGIGAGAPIFQVVALLWFSAVASSLLDNVPMTQVLIPIVAIMAQGSILSSHQYFYSLAIGANWGDNLTPLGDNILVIQLAKKNKRPIAVMDFWKLGFVATIIQLTCATVYLLLVLKPLMGVTMVLIILTVLTIFIILNKYSTSKIQSMTNQLIENFRSIILHSKVKK